MLDFFGGVFTIFIIFVVLTLRKTCHEIWKCTILMSVFFFAALPSSRKPINGYMDLQLSIRIEEMVCELQLNTEKVALPTP